jgi:hypothetical protein
MRELIIIVFCLIFLPISVLQLLTKNNVDFNFVIDFFWNLKVDVRLFFYCKMYKLLENPSDNFI